MGDTRTFVLDLDGVVYRGKQPLPGAVKTIETLRRLGHQVYFFTNNSTKTRVTYQQKLEGMGIPVDLEHIMTSSYATALYLEEQGAQGKSVLVIGREGIKEELRAVGMVISDDEKVDYVVVGMDRDFCYDTLTKAQHAIMAGGTFIATNRDASFPCEDGTVVPGGGAMVAAIEVASGVKPILIGKPETPAMMEVLHLAHATPKETVVVGDRLDTDILVAKRIGALSVLVLTGIATEKDLKHAPPEMQPDVVIRNLGELLDTVLSGK
ncbi:MAG TPA: HAD-IIA family hydrolase [Armatimonadota bacterium]|nr:HAD-IIA family hydrolase [Armatimonadota bacterium]